jgi:hypothetical protein
VLGYKSTRDKSFVLRPGSRCKDQVDLGKSALAQKKISTMLMNLNMSFFCQIKPSSAVTSDAEVSCVGDSIMNIHVLNSIIE